MEKIIQSIQIGPNSNATLIGYINDFQRMNEEVTKRPTVVLCPGGGYRRISNRESDPIVYQLLAKGFHVFVLNYSIQQIFPVALLELAESFCFIREDLNHLNIDRKRIIVGGFQREDI